MANQQYDLRDLIRRLTEDFPEITGLHLFGSRRHGSKSNRSDIDVIVETNDHVRPSDLRDLSQQICPALDMFLLEGGKAVSCINDSYVKAADRDSLLRQLDAVQFWPSSESKYQGPNTFQVIERNMPFPASSLPDMEVEGTLPRWITYKLERFGEDSGLPTRPFIGKDSEEVAEFLVKIMERAPEIASKARRKGNNNFSLSNEYDCQDLFWMVTRPWLPELGREEIAAWFDGQKKIADFNYSRNRIIIEMKYIKDASTKAEVAKQLGGLSGFYKENTRVEILIFCIYVDKKASVDLESDRWESRFSSTGGECRVIVTVIDLRHFLPRDLVTELQAGPAK